MAARFLEICEQDARQASTEDTIRARLQAYSKRSFRIGRRAVI
jgi:hypothetical protein